MHPLDETKYAKPQHAILPAIEQRWSPRAFQEKPVAEAALRRLFEAARWAPSSYNEQPWRFLVGVKGEGTLWERLYRVLFPGNQLWAVRAPVLLLVCGKTHFSHNGTPNRAYVYDCGAAMAYLSLQVTAEGLGIHQLAGFDVEQARAEFNIPEGFEPLVMGAIGHRTDSTALPEEPAYLRAQEEGERKRHPQAKFVFGDAWGTAW